MKALTIDNYWDDLLDNFAEMGAYLKGNPAVTLWIGLSLMMMLAMVIFLSRATVGNAPNVVDSIKGKASIHVYTNEMLSLTGFDNKKALAPRKSTQGGKSPLLKGKNKKSIAAVRSHSDGETTCSDFSYSSRGFSQLQIPDSNNSTLARKARRASQLECSSTTKDHATLNLHTNVPSNPYLLLDKDIRDAVKVMPLVPDSPDISKLPESQSNRPVTTLKLAKSPRITPKNSASLTSDALGKVSQETKACRSVSKSPRISSAHLTAAAQPAVSVRIPRVASNPEFKSVPLSPIFTPHIKHPSEAEAPLSPPLTPDSPATYSEAVCRSTINPLPQQPATQSVLASKGLNVFPPFPAPQFNAPALKRTTSSPSLGASAYSDLKIPSIVLSETSADGVKDSNRIALDTNTRAKDCSSVAISELGSLETLTSIFEPTDNPALAFSKRTRRRCVSDLSAFHFDLFGGATLALIDTPNVDDSIKFASNHSIFDKPQTSPNGSFASARSRSHSGANMGLLVLDNGEHEASIPMDASAMPSYELF